MVKNLALPMQASQEFVLTLSCADTKGIVYAVSGLLYQAGCNIVSSQQFGDVQHPEGTGLFFMRVHFEAPQHLGTPGLLDQLFTHVRQDVARVEHSLSPEDLTAVGRDVESVVLARAVRWHVEHRVLMNGHKTVVFK